MALSNNQPTMIQHFADPHHPLVQTQYRDDEAGLCNICLLKLAGGGRRSSVTYGCYTCNIHLHGACARYFQEAISFFAHPAHTLRLRRSPGRVCDICRGDCPSAGSFVYSCIDCGFDVHPLCSMLPEKVASPWDPSHQLSMFSSESPAGSCSACHHPLPRWHYIGSSVKLHIIPCAVDPAAGQGSSGGAAAAVPVYGAAGSYGGAAVVQQGSHGAVSSQRSLFGAPAGPVTGPAGYYCYFPPPPIQYSGPAMPSSFGGGYNGGLMSGIAMFLARTFFIEGAHELIFDLLSSSN